MVTPEIGGAIRTVIDEGTRRKFRAARKSGVHESQDAYAADAFAEAIVGDPGQAKSGGWTTHVVIDHAAPAGRGQLAADSVGARVGRCGGASAAALWDGHP